MLAAAPRPFPRVQSDGSAMPLPDASVDGVTCGFALRTSRTWARRSTSSPASFVRGAALRCSRWPPHPTRAAIRPRCLLRTGRAPHRRRALRRRRLPLPPPLGGLPARADQMLSMLESAGFTHVRRSLLSVGIAQLITATRDGSERPAGTGLLARTRSVDLDPGLPGAGTRTWWRSARRGRALWASARRCGSTCPHRGRTTWTGGGGPRGDRAGRHHRHARFRTGCVRGPSVRPSGPGDTGRTLGDVRPDRGRGPMGHHRRRIGGGPTGSCGWVHRGGTVPQRRRSPASSR